MCGDYAFVSVLCNRRAMACILLERMGAGECGRVQKVGRQGAAERIICCRPLGSALRDRACGCPFRHEGRNEGGHPLHHTRYRKLSVMYSTLGQHCQSYSSIRIQ